MSNPPTAKIGYLVNSYPVLSETFIRNEIRTVSDAGIELVVFRLAPPDSGQRMEDEDEPSVVDMVRGRTAVLARIRAHLSLLMRRPRPYLSTLRRGVLVYSWRYLINRTERQQRALVKRRRRFSRAVWMARQARRHGVVHFHAHYAKEPLEVAELVRRLEGIPYSFAAHAKDLYTAPAERLARRLYRARFAVACHPHGARRLQRLTPQGGSKILYIPHGLDTRLFRPTMAPREPNLILAVGRLTPKKGFEHLLVACALLQERGQRVRLVLIGDGRCRAALRRQCHELGLHRAVELRHSLPQAELPQWYRRAALFAMPAQVLEDGNRDGIPNVLLEAMACGTPVVASGVSSIPDAVADGATGLLVPPRDPDALAAAIQRLLDDPGFAARLGAAAARSVARLDYRLTNQALVDELRPLVSSRSEAALTRVMRDAWRDEGRAEQAARRLGLRPCREPRVEEGIRAAIAPGIAANAWRPDLDRLVERRLWDEVFKARRVPEILATLGIERPGARILDLGCGRGGLSVALAARGHHVTGLDLRYRNCLVTRFRGWRYALDVATTASAGERLPYADAAFDAVVCLEVLEHVLDPVALLAEIRRVLCSSGRCLITVINRWAHLDPHYRLWGLNFLPPSWAQRYIRFRGRLKHSYRDLQTLEEMHYYSFPAFLQLAEGLGYRVVDPHRPDGPLASRLHDLKRRCSLGFNTARLVLEPRPRLRQPASPAQSIVERQAAAMR